MDRLQSCEHLMEELQMKQQHQRELYEHQLVLPIESKRRDLQNVLDAMVERVEIVSPYIKTGSSLASENSIGAESVEGNGNNDNGDGDITDSTKDLRSSFSSTSRTQPGGLMTPGSSAGAGNTNSPSTSTTSALSKIGASLWGTSASIVGSIGRGVGAVVGPVSSSVSDYNSNDQQTRNRRQSLDETGDDSSSSTAIPFITSEECEARMKALDSAELSPLYTLNAEEQPAGVIRQVERFIQSFSWIQFDITYMCIL
jgi:hypothetical protein